jgi:hypothetical protein
MRKDLFDPHEQGYDFITQKKVFLLRLMPVCVGLKMLAAGSSVTKSIGLHKRSAVILAFTGKKIF